MIIPQTVLSAIYQIEACGFDAYLVGGCVRDMLMGKSPCDWDITTSALPRDIQKIFSSHNVIPTGIRHGTVTVIFDGIPLEITTFRIDGSYTDNRHPENVMFSTSITEDLKRRDFTVNAIAYNPKTVIIDPFNGRADLQDGVIRAVGDPAARFSEDALRIMRAVRFSAVLGFEIEKNTSKALFECCGLLETIAAERITSELNKTLLADNATSVLIKYFALMSQRLFANSPSTVRDTAVFGCISHIPPHLSLRLAAFLFCAAQIFESDIMFTARDFFSRLKYDNKTRHETVNILANLHRDISLSRIAIRRIISEIGAETLQGVLELKTVIQPDNRADTKGAKDIFEAILQDGDCCHIRNLAVNGSDLISRFKLSGKAVGAALDFLLEAVIQNKCENKKSSLIEYLNKNI